VDLVNQAARGALIVTRIKKPNTVAGTETSDTATEQPSESSVPGKEPTIAVDTEEIPFEHTYEPEKVAATG